MSEHISDNSKETFNHIGETAAVPETNRQHTEKKETPQHRLESLETIRKKVEQQASPQEASPFEKQAERPTTSTIRSITKRLKTERYKTTLQQVRRHLPPVQRLTSKLIHQPAIEAISEVGSKTVARPSGLLGGGLIALVGSLSVILVAKHIGFAVPHSIFWVLFLIGFFLGLVIEFIARHLRGRRASR
jgi:hypothetical protein